MSTSSAPIATSTPVNFAAGTVSPPPLTLAAVPAPPHQEQPVQPTPTAKVTTYPAVLKGRTAASPPIPNLVPSGKIPPPVPPRGTGQSRTTRSSEEHRGPGTTATLSTSSITSSRGDEAAIITRYRLHENSSILHHHHHPPSSPDYISTSTVSALPGRATNSTSIVAATTSNTAIANTANYRNSNFTITHRTSIATNASVLHASASTPVYLPPRYDNLSKNPRAFQSIQEKERPVNRWTDWTENMYGEEEEFVSVEKVNGSYVIRTSPYPFRPERGNFKHPRERSNVDQDTAKNLEEQTTENLRAHNLAKFTYFLNPQSRPELMNYKMSRKDKKHSETYYERVKRKQKELEASINTITTLTRRSEPDREKKLADDKTRFEGSRVDKCIRKQEKNGGKKIDVLKLSERRRDSKLLRKIKEKSARRRKKLAPEPSSKMQTLGAIRKMDDVRLRRKVDDFKRKETRGETSLATSYGNTGERLTKSTSDVRAQGNTDHQVVLKTDKRLFLVTKVDERTTTKCKSAEAVYSAMETDSRKVSEKSTLSKPSKSDDVFINRARLNTEFLEEIRKKSNEKSKILKPVASSSVPEANASFLHGYDKSPQKF